MNECDGFIYRLESKFLRENELGDLVQKIGINI